ncbi:FadR/GntR family transcriptional regulator [Kineosporia sp. NBRC 101731]|uniref:FadR/GntR family transcriptional regulator n=1 Tax=Kineosporia sp. NBRC 101731 TaxID=3032199 RepID=UPI0024A16643|nr:FadR/GntR family transcriptional regulator [Kineosporia sp. NBRC 101731]GLY27970.1 GntR family transcriptional regulator [Kineosporia sp. NBRC 101731]
MSAPVSEAPSSLRTTRRAGLIDQVIEQLRTQITSGAWAVGERIPTETELSQLTATSRNTVREAVQSLVHAGLLERRQGSGTYVLAASELAGAVSRRVAGARRLDVLEVRRTLEVGAARLAASRRTPADIALLRELHADRQNARDSGDVDELVVSDVSLHRAIVQASHNPVMIDLYENLVDALQENVRFNVAVIAPGDDDHHALVDAVIMGDAEAAAAEAAAFLDALIAGSDMEDGAVALDLEVRRGVE